MTEPPSKDVPTPEQARLDSVRQRLEQIMAELQRLLEECQKPPAGR